MLYHRCPACALSVQCAPRRFTTVLCPSCSVPLEVMDEDYMPERRPASISRRLVAEPRAAATARRALEMLLWELDPSAFDVAALLTTELVTNSVAHAGTDIVRLDAALDDRLVRVEVRDGGPGFTPAARAADSPLESHWGLHLVEELAARWGVSTEPETMVWFELDTSAPAVAPSVRGADLELASEGYLNR